MNELSKVKHDLEVALKEVLQAMRANDGTSSMAISNPNLEKLANVNVSHVPKQQHIFFIIVSGHF